MRSKIVEETKKKFAAYFGVESDILVRTPGRVEIIGGHTDYNEGFVLPMAIEREAVVAARRRSDNRVRLYSEYFDEEVEFDLSGSIASGKPDWANYAKGVSALLIRAGKELIGLDMYLASDIPVGGGLSSSAAIESAYAKTFLASIDDNLDPIDLALLCQEAEHTFANSPCGIMDQMICILGKENHALLLDCRSLEFSYIRMPTEKATILIADTKVKHDLGQSEYPLRRQQCEQAVEKLKLVMPEIKALRDVSLDELEKHKDLLDPIIYNRAKHAISENERVLKMAEALESNDLSTAGKMMTESHNSLRDNYQVSCEELDFLVEQAISCKGVYGARMSGGGFGGCIVALVDISAVDRVTQRLVDLYTEEFGGQPEVFTTQPAGGAEVIYH